MRFVIAAGTTRTAAIEGISAAGGDADVMRHTPSADVEIVEYGRPVCAPVVPVSPSGCPTPAVVTRAVRKRLKFDTLLLDAGLAMPTAAPTVNVADPGHDLRDPEPVPEADATVDAARELGRTLPDREVVIGESIPGGTTTALGVLRALGEPYDVSSSLAENPLPLKRDVVSDGLDASGVSAGDAAGKPLLAIRRMGDPVLAAVFGLAAGAASQGADVTLAGGTQMIAAAALLRHADVEGPIRVATTAFVAADREADLRRAATNLDLSLAVTDPGFDQASGTAFARYRDGEAKEGVGMGGALWLAERHGVPMGDVRDGMHEILERLSVGSYRDPVGTGSGEEPG